MLAQWIISVLTACLLTARSLADSTECVRRPTETNAEKKVGNNGFQLEVHYYTGSNGGPVNATTPDGYVPGEYYILKIRGWHTKYTVQTFRGFGVFATTVDKNEPAGVFDVSQNAESMVSLNCPSGVSHSSLHPKTEVDVLWRAPDSNVGCIQFKAMVLEYRDIWYMDDGPLTQKFCQITKRRSLGYEKLLPDDKAEKCCACDEAKYEMVFDGIWSRQTHPKDFPSLEHLTHFSDIIGASHSNDFVMWALGNYATDGLKELAEWGNTYKYEQELKHHAKEIRTIIKAKGLWYPEVQGTTKASFRVDKYHHLTSLASMFGPSPDWCVGVSQINLCMPDCSWIPERTFDLYPWDAGTDNGVTYMSPNTPAQPRHKIKEITTKDDPRSPFYDAHVSTMRPMARLKLRRIALYPMQCKTDEQYRQAALNSTTSEEEEYKDRRECMVGDWTPWSLCSATCGKGIRMRSRVYKFAVKAQMFNCQRQMTEKQFCNAQISVCEDSEAFNDKCSVTSWGEWSSCTVTCGNGQRSRTRNFINPTTAAGSGCTVDLQEEESCAGEYGKDCSVTPNPLCKTTPWSNWSPCSASCGDGMKVRTRLFFYAENKHLCPDTSLMEKEPCTLQSCRRFFVRHSTEICQEEKEEGQCAGTFPRYWYNANMRRCERFIYTGCKGNRNQFETEDQCKAACLNGYESEQDGIVPANHLASVLGLDEGTINDGGEPLDCMVTEWSPWSNCSKSCGTGKRQRTRSIKVLPRNGGKPCPPKMVQKRRCEMRPCPARSCHATQWTAWSPCTASCGPGIQMRQRRIIKPRGYYAYERQDEGSIQNAILTNGSHVLTGLRMANI